MTVFLHLLEEYDSEVVEVSLNTEAPKIIVEWFARECTCIKTL